MAVKTDEEHFYENATFLVQETLFRFPKEVLTRESETIKTMFALPGTSGSSVTEGATNENPIKLEGIEVSDFRALLKLFFPTATLSHSDIDLTVAQLRSVLKLSTMWDMDRIRGVAISELEKKTIDPVEKILLARDFDIPAWLIPTFTELIQSGRDLTLSEAQSLGMDWVLKWAKARHTDSTTAFPSYDRWRRNDAPQIFHDGSRWCHPTETAATVRQVFDLNPDGTPALMRTPPRQFYQDPI